MQTIHISDKCEHCTLRKDIDDGMNITSYCIYDDKPVDKFYSKCHLSDEDKEEIKDKKLVEEVYIQ